jgi:D-serine deaminase-like pyridoxal phosphate-dependent protein
MCEIGIKKEEIDTPALLIDLDVMKRNLFTMANFFRGKAKLRAHTKVHRTPILAHKQIEMGSKGICCQKVEEAKVMVTAGIKDIIVTNQIVVPCKIKRLVSMAKYVNISVPVDNPKNADVLSKAALKEGVKLNVLVDIHLGSHRCGVEPGEPALKLAKYIDTLHGLKLIGLMGFEGHLSWMEPRDVRRKECEKLEGLLVNTKKIIEKAGIPIEEISTGTTGTYDVSGTYPEVTEVQAGSYLLMDAMYHKHVSEFECAISVLSTIISVPSADRAVSDAGLMSFSTTYGNPEMKCDQDVVGEVREVHAENTVINVKTGKLEIGDKIEFIPTYLDGTVFLHDKFYAVRREKLEAVWNILGRGKSK